MRSLDRRRLYLGRALGSAALLAALLLAANGLLGGLSHAWADNGTQSSGGQKVVVFEDVTIGADEVWDTVVVVGGDVVVQGTVEGVLVVVGGDLTVGPEANIGTNVRPEDTAVVSVFGDITVDPGGRVHGRSVDVAGSISDAVGTALVDPVLRPWRVGSIVTWAWSTVFLIVAGLIAAVVAPRQLATVRDRARVHFFSSMGWGALGAIIVVPIVTALLIVTVIGIIVAVPWLAIGLPLMFLFGFSAVGAMIGRLILGARRDEREYLMAATVLGLVIFSVLRWIPVAGTVILALLWFVGFGATYVALWTWLRNRRRRKHQTADGPNE